MSDKETIVIEIDSWDKLDEVATRIIEQFGGQK